MKVMFLVQVYREPKYISRCLLTRYICAISVKCNYLLSNVIFITCTGVCRILIGIGENQLHANYLKELIINQSENKDTKGHFKKRAVYIDQLKIVLLSLMIYVIFANI